MDDHPPERVANRFIGDNHATVIQTGAINGPVYLSVRRGPLALEDVALDVPRPDGPVRGRTRLLDDLLRLRRRPDGLPLVLYGMGGAGKSTLAAELAVRASEEGVRTFWIRPESVLDAMLWTAVELGASVAEAERMREVPDVAARWVWERLDGSERPWLLVFDNLDRPVETNRGHRPGSGTGWVRGSRAGTVVVTTRSGQPELWRPAHLYHVPPLSPEDAVLVLDDNASGEWNAGKRPGALPAAAWSLARRLGGIPLVLRLAGRLVRERPLDLGDYESALAVLGGSLRELQEFIDPVSRDYGEGEAVERRRLDRVWRLSLELVEREVPQARPLLDVLSLIGADGVSVPLRRLETDALRGTAVDTGPGELTAAVLNRAIRGLVDHSLADLRRVNGEPALSIHPLVAEVVRAGLADQGRDAAEAADRLLARGNGADLAMEEVAYRTVLRIRQQSLGSDHPQTLGTRFGHARLQARRGRLESAEAGFLRVAKGRARTLGADHPDTWAAHYELARAAFARGDLESAEQTFRTVADERKRALGPDHPDTWFARYGVARALQARGDLDAAEAEFRVVAEGRARVLGTDHPDTWIARFNLALIAMDRGDLSGAEAEYRRVLENLTRLVGADHPESLRARHGLALCLRGQGRREEAQSEFELALAGRERMLGPDHPHTEESRAALADS